MLSDENAMLKLHDIGNYGNHCFIVIEREGETIKTTTRILYYSAKVYEYETT
jgi:hypothetical protein